MWDSIQLHVSPVAIAELVPRVPPVENRHFIKPKWGLWTSTYDAELHTSAWVDWCLAEEFSDVTAGSWFLLTPDPRARVFVIDGLSDLEYLTDAYPEPGTEAYTRRFFACLDFERLSQVYDAIHMTEAGQWATRHSTPNLNGWDVECTLWFHWRFTDVRKLPRQTSQEAPGAARTQGALP